MILKNKITNLKTFEKLLIFLILTIFIFQIFSFIQFNNNYFSSEEDQKSCSYFFPENIRYLDDYEVEKQKRDIYVFPEIKNVLCLGKVINYEVQSEKLLIYIGTNSKFLNLIILFSQFSLMTLYLYFLGKKNYMLINSFVIFFIISNFSLSLNSTSYLYLFLFPTIFFFTNNSDEVLKTKMDLNKLDKFDLLPIILIFLFLFIVQFSSHNYETIDWDINAYLATSMEVGRGFLPLETQFENKPPLLFFIYFLFASFAKGDLLPIKILNDLVLFSSILVFYFLFKRQSNSKIEALLYSSVLVLFTSNYWFHPGFSEIYSLLFISISYLLLLKKSKSNYIYLISGIIFCLSTLVNIGSTIFLIGFGIIILLMPEGKIKGLIFFIFGFALVHLIFLILYSWKNLLTEYLISIFYIPISYSQTNFEIFSEITVFLTSLLEYNFFVFLLFMISVINVVSKFIACILNKKKLYSNHSVYEFTLFCNGVFFYYFAGKGYYHHLFYILFFIVFGLLNIPGRIYKNLIFTLIIVSSFQIVNSISNQSINNIKNFGQLENNYPLKNISNLLENEIQKDDKILATENVLLLYYLNLPNESYIVHPALYEYDEIFNVLKKYNKVRSNEIEYQISKSPKLIEGSIKKIDPRLYEVIEVKSFQNNFIHYFEKNRTVSILIRK